jgi:two-component system cell cycle sensor histidine kinase/response regulator CckA
VTGPPDSLRILVVDDDPDLCFGTARALSKANYQTEMASDGDGALQKLQDFQPHLVVLDRDMPDPDGVELCRRIKARPDADQIFVILISGTYIGSDQQAEGLESGADGYLVRPLGNRELVARVDVFVRLRQLTQSLRDRQKELTEKNRELLESEDRFRATFEQAAVGIAHLDLGGRWLRVNQRLCDIVGYAREELLQLGYHDITHPDDVGLDEVQIERLKAGEIQSYVREKRYLRKDGSTVWVNLTASLLQDTGGQAKNFISVVEDISARKESEAEQERLRQQLTQTQKMDSVGRLAGGVAHDFNNLLTVILGHSESVLETLTPGTEIWQSLQAVNHAARRSATLTRQLLAFARRQTIAPRVLDPNQTIEELLAVIDPLVGQKLKLDWQPDPEAWTLKMDPSQLEQVLTNLCVNARDAVGESGTVVIQTSNSTLDSIFCAENPGSQPGEYLKLTVSDNGCGMDPEILENMFEPFFTTKETGRGTGLGLATVYGIVKQNRGFIQVNSAPGEGTTFHIYLPRAEGPIEEPGTPAPPALVAPDTRTILLVDDDEEILGVTRAMLENLGYGVLATSSALAALKIIRERSSYPDLLLTDVVMPEMNGHELAEAMRGVHQGILCLFMSGYSEDVVARHGVLHSGVHFIQKPFTRDELAAKLAGVFLSSRQA